MSLMEILQIVSDIIIAILGVLGGHHVIRTHLKDRSNDGETRAQRKISKKQIKINKIQEKTNKRLEKLSVLQENELKRLD